MSNRKKKSTSSWDYFSVVKIFGKALVSKCNDLNNLDVKKLKNKRTCRWASKEINL